MLTVGRNEGRSIQSIATFLFNNFHICRWRVEMKVARYRALPPPLARHPRNPLFVEMKVARYRALPPTRELRWTLFDPVEMKVARYRQPPKKKPCKPRTLWHKRETGASVAACAAYPSAGTERPAWASSAVQHVRRFVARLNFSRKMKVARYRAF